MGIKRFKHLVSGPHLTHLGDTVGVDVDRIVAVFELDLHPELGVSDLDTGCETLYTL